MSVIFERRSVRSFLPKPVEPEKIERILRAGFEAPSAHNRRPWEFMVITAENDRKAIADMSPYAKMTASAAAAIIPCANLNLGNASGEEDTWWVQDLSAATENILLQIAEEELGGVWLGWYPDGTRVKAFSRHFSLPPHIVPFSVIALGYPAGPVKPADRFDPAKVHYGAYGNHSA
ncbi:MAG: nitroreductase family protein [Spirochaetaceae bacterium]|jgi:nitroreductase|nr:nitroreductase family protein [Spirochaetaceae bacterium]